MNRHFFLVLGFILAGCTSLGPGSGTTKSSGDNFQLNTGPDGRVYRINNQTGEVWVAVDGTLKKIHETKVEPLKIGQKYFIEDNFSIIYQGKGKFTEPVKDYSHLWN